MTPLRFVLPLVAAFLCTFADSGQIVTAKGAHSDIVNDKIHKLDLLIKLEPIAFTKDQFPDLLAGLDKARKRQKELLQQEDDVLDNLDPIVSKAVDDAVQKGIYPPRDIQDLIAKNLHGAQMHRVIVGANMVNDVWIAVQSKLNAGQRKAMENSFSPAMVDSSVKPETITDEVKLRFYVRYVLLDPLAYDLLVEMSKHAS